MSHSCCVSVTITGENKKIQRIAEILKEVEESDSLFGLFYPIPKEVDIEEIWITENWGAGAPATEAMVLDISDDSIAITFGTDGLPPLIFLRRISKDFKVLVEAKYLGDENRFVGRIVCKNGKVILEDTLSSPTSEQIEKFGFKVPVEIEIVGFWKSEPNEEIVRNCMIGVWDQVSNDDHIFYWFDEDEEIIGDHGDFVVVDYRLGWD